MKTEPPRGIPLVYPARPPFFALRFIRLMVKSVVASTLGEDVFALLSVIATTEDARRYKSPVTFFNGQLAPLTGAKSWDALNRTRTKAVGAEWLIHIAPARGQRLPSTYWVTIPEGLEDIEDGPVDEGLSAERLSYLRGIEDGRQALLTEQAAIRKNAEYEHSTLRDNAEREHSHSTENTDQVKLDSRINHESKHGSIRLGNAEHSILSLTLNPIPKNTCSEADKPHSKPAATLFENEATEQSTPEPVEVLLKFPTRGKVKEWHLTRPQVEIWKADFAGLDVLAECRKGRAWCEANSDRRKTPKGMPNFLITWLGKAANSGGFNGQQIATQGRNGKPSLAGGPGVQYDPATRNNPAAGVF